MVDLTKFQQYVKGKSPAFVPLFQNKSRYQVPWGGAGSGKSHIVARKLLYRMLNESDVKHNFLIIRKVDRTIKKSVWTLMKNIISIWGLASQFHMNQTDRTMIWKHRLWLYCMYLQKPERVLCPVKLRRSILRCRPSENRSQTDVLCNIAPMVVHYVSTRATNVTSGTQQKQEIQSNKWGLQP